ncbi:unnamed protein product [Urochloa humidicola]
MIEVVLNDRLGKKVRVKCNEDDTIGDLKRLVAAQTGTRAEKIRIQSTPSTRTTSPSPTTRSTTAWASSSTTTSSLYSYGSDLLDPARSHGLGIRSPDHRFFSFSSEVCMYAYHMM